MAINWYDPTTNPTGHWIDCFNDNSGPGLAGWLSTSRGRCLPFEHQLYPNPAGHGLNPYSKDSEGFKITVGLVGGSHAGDDNFISPWNPAGGYTGVNAPAVPYQNVHTYYSGMGTTRDIFAQQYGSFRWVGRMPNMGGVPGLFPAYWMKNFATLAEIDVIEVMSGAPRELHFHSPQNTGTAVSGKEVCTMPATWDPYGFHEFRVDWTAGLCVWYVDGNEMFRKTTSSNFNTPMSPCFDLAIKNTWNDITAPSSSIVGKTLTTKSLIILP